MMHYGITCVIKQILILKYFVYLCILLIIGGQQLTSLFVSCHFHIKTIGHAQLSFRLEVRENIQILKVLLGLLRLFSFERIKEVVITGHQVIGHFL